jgi:hypothetical protein
MAASVLINGVNYSWENTNVLIFGQILTGITKVSIKSKQTKDNNYGIGKKPISRGYGNVEFEGSMSVYFDELLRWIKATGNGDILEIPYFDFPIMLVGKRVLPHKIVVRGAEFIESPFENSQGDTKIIVDVPLVIGDIDWKN